MPAAATAPSSAADQAAPPLLQVDRLTVRFGPHEVLRDMHRQMDALRQELAGLRQDLAAERTATPADRTG